MNNNPSASLEQELSAPNVGARLRVARETAGLTQADAASSIDVARTTLVAIEKGQRRIRTDELQRLARRYQTSVNALFATSQYLLISSLASASSARSATTLPMTRPGY